jgi:hypothetical protein
MVSRSSFLDTRSREKLSPSTLDLALHRSLFTLNPEHSPHLLPVFPFQEVSNDLPLTFRPSKELHSPARPSRHSNEAGGPADDHLKMKRVTERFKDKIVTPGLDTPGQSGFVLFRRGDNEIYSLQERLLHGQEQLRVVHRQKVLVFTRTGHHRAQVQPESGVLSTGTMQKNGDW